MQRPCNGRLASLAEFLLLSQLSGVPAFRRAAKSGKPSVIELRQDPEQITTRATITQLRAAGSANPGAPKHPVAAPVARKEPKKRKSR